MTKREELTDPRSCLSRASDEELIFVLLERDAAAPTAIIAWAIERVRLGKNSIKDKQIIDAMTLAVRMKDESYRGDG